MNNFIDILRHMGNGFAAANQGEFLHARSRAASKRPADSAPAQPLDWGIIGVPLNLALAECKS